MIRNKFTTHFDILRSSWSVQSVDGVDVDISEESTVGSFNGYIQSATAEYAQYTGLTLTKGYSVWCPSLTPVAEGDVIVAGGVAYQVRARQEFPDSTNPHVQLAVEMIGTDYGDSI